MIKIENISKHYYTEEVDTIALDNVSFHIEQGEFIAIMGPSGCGKSTLMNILGLLDSPTSGTYSLMGKNVSGMNEYQRTEYRKGRIGFVFQNYNLIEEFTVYENVEVPLIYMNMRASERKQKVKEILDCMNISHRAWHYPSQLSGGQQQRVAIARALVLSPKLILADEPTGNLDSRNGKEVLDTLTMLNREGTTIVMVTHSSRDAAYAGRVLEMMDGKII